MKKSELFARYDLFGKEVIEITEQEFYQKLQDNKESTNIYESGSTEYWVVKTDGADYMQYSSMWNVGWQGDVDSDQFYCKVETLTKAEVERLTKIFTQAPQEIHEQFI